MLDYNVTFGRPWVFAIIAVAALILFIPYFRTPKNKRRSIGRIVSLVARCVAVVVAMFLFSDITIVEETPVPQEEAIVVVVDCSRSLEGDIDDPTGAEDMSTLIDSYIENLISSKSPTTQIQFIKFAGNASVCTSGFTTDGELAYEEYSKASIEDVKPTEATNISAALRKALPLFEKVDAYKRVILISDGRETEGSAWEAAAEFEANSIRLDTVMFDVTKEEGFAEVSILSLGVLPDHTVAAGETVRLQVELYSSVETSGVLNFYFGDEDDYRYPVNISKGRNVFSGSFKTSVDNTGLMELRASFSPDKNDTISANNHMSTWIKVTGKPNVLLVGAPEQTQKLYDQVSGIYNTDQVTADAFPNTMKELLQYDEVVLMNVPHQDLPSEADEMLYHYVHDIGRGLLTTSGQTQGTYMSYSDNESLLADMLPVNMTLDETEHNVAIVIVIDDSSSMIPGHYSQDGADKFQPALDGAQKVIEALGENDYVGVVTFHRVAEVQLELTKAEGEENKKILIDKVQSLDAIENFGTAYDKGLNEARDMLANFDGARSKHVIFLSDGYPTEGDFSQLPSSMKNMGISVHTIALLTDAGAKNTLANIAKEGGGKSFAIDDASQLETLSNIMENLTVEAKEPQFINTEPFHPLVGDDTGVLNQVDAAEMMLGGYIGSTVKTNADMPLHTNDFRPLIAEWEYGKGYVTTLMMDISSSWCDDFFTDKNNGYGLVKNLVKQSINDEEIMISGITLESKKSDSRVHLTANTSYHVENQMVKVKVFNGGGFYASNTADGKKYFDPSIKGELGEIVLNSAGGTKYTGIFDPKAMTNTTGVLDTNRTYYFCVVQCTTKTAEVDGEIVLLEDDILDWTVLAYSGGILAEYDIYNIDGAEVMNGIAKTGGGESFTKDLVGISDLFSIVKEGTEEHFVDMMFPLAITLMSLLMIDILARCINFKRKKKKQ